MKNICKVQPSKRRSKWRTSQNALRKDKCVKYCNVYSMQIVCCFANMQRQLRFHLPFSFKSIYCVVVRAAMVVKQPEFAYPLWDDLHINNLGVQLPEFCDDPDADNFEGAGVSQNSGNRTPVIYVCISSWCPFLYEGNRALCVYSRFLLIVCILTQHTFHLNSGRHKNLLHT